MSNLFYNQCVNTLMLAICLVSTFIACATVLSLLSTVPIQEEEYCTCAATNSTCEKINPLAPSEGSAEDIAIRKGLYNFWGAYNVVITIFWIGFVVMKRKTKPHLGIVKAFIVIYTIEAIFFFIRANGDQNMVFPYGLSMQMFGGAMLWMGAFFLSRIGRPWSSAEVIPRLVLALTIAAIFAFYIIAMMTMWKPDAEDKGMPNVKPVFLAWFEPPQIMAMTFTLASIGNVCEVEPGVLPHPSFHYFCGTLILFTAHIASMYYSGSKPCAMGTSFQVLYILSQTVGSVIAQWGMVRMINADFFEINRQKEKDAVFDNEMSKLELEKEEKEKTNEEHHTSTAILSPEMIYTFGVPMVLIGYAGSASLLTYVTKPALETDPVFLLYGTFHPCILLDYLPGTLWAQFFFGLGIIMSQFSMLAAFYRTTLYGDGISSMFQAFLFGFYWVLSCFFVLVFTLNPQVTFYSPVLLHSFPYMLMNICNAFFCIVSILVVYRWKGLDGKAGVTAVGTVYTMAIVYGTFFMSGKLMTEAGMNLLEEKDLSNPAELEHALEDVKDLGLSFDPGPMIITLIGQAGILMFGLISPLRFRPLAMEVFTDEANVPAELTANPDVEREAENEYEGGQHASRVTKIKNRLKVKARTPLAAAATVMCFTFYAGVEFDMRVWPQLPTDDPRIIFRRHPASAIFAVGWMILANFLVAHVVITVIHEWRQNRGMRMLVALAGVLLLAGALVGIGATIPNRIGDKHILTYQATGCPNPTPNMTKLPEEVGNNMTGYADLDNIAVVSAMMFEACQSRTATCCGKLKATECNPTCALQEGWGEIEWYKTTDWWYGLEFFLLTVALWVAVDVILVLELLARSMKSKLKPVNESSWFQRHLRCVAILEIIVGVITIGFALAGAITMSIDYDKATLISFFVFSFMDSRGVEVNLVNMRVATKVDMMEDDGEEWGFLGGEAYKRSFGLPYATSARGSDFISLYADTSDEDATASDES